MNWKMMVGAMLLVVGPLAQAMTCQTEGVDNQETLDVQVVSGQAQVVAHLKNGNFAFKGPYKQKQSGVGGDTYQSKLKENDGKTAFLEVTSAEAPVGRGGGFRGRAPWHPTFVVSAQLSFQKKDLFFDCDELP